MSTIGTLVFYVNDRSNPLAWIAFICGIKSDGKVNIAGFNESGEPFSIPNITICDTEKPAEGPYAFYGKPSGVTNMDADPTLQDTK